jgi:hypothetical protein
MTTEITVRNIVGVSGKPIFIIADTMNEAPLHVFRNVFHNSFLLIEVYYRY